MVLGVPVHTRMVQDPLGMRDGALSRAYMGGFDSVTIGGPYYGTEAPLGRLFGTILEPPL